MRRILLALSPLALLAACQEPATPPPEPPPSVVLGGVDLGQPLRVGGNEPFWAVEITPAELKYSGVDRPEQVAPNPRTRGAGTTAVFTTTTDQNLTLVVTLMDTDCSDGMSDRVYPLIALVQIGPETLNGCAASVSDLASGEVVREEDAGAPAQAQAPAQ